jgi:hypothetical protein
MPFNIIYVHPTGIQCTLIAANIPDLDAAKIVSGVFDEARIPHTFVNDLRTGNVEVTGWLELAAGLSFGWTEVITVARVLQNVTMDAGLVTSGVFNAARVAPDVLTTQGDILIRGAAGYERLGFGVNGQFLKTQGAGANPTWATVSGVVGEGHITILPIAYDSIGQGTWAFSINSLYYLNGSLQNTTHNDGDNVSYRVYLDAGTYTLLLMYHRSTHVGIVDVDIDADEVASKDAYGVLAYNQIFTQTGIVVASAGLKTLKFRIHGKNGLSDNHYIDLVAIALWRTA